MFLVFDQKYSAEHRRGALRERLYEYVQIICLLVVIFSVSNLLISNWNDYSFSYPSNSIFRTTTKTIESMSLLVLSFSLVIVFLEIDIAGFKIQVMSQLCDEVGYHRLSKEEVLDNENRENIINAVYADPGIHYNKLLRICDLQPGQLQWHLKILLEYGILEEQRWGRYVMFYLKQNLTTDQQERLRHPVLKSSTTRTIFRLIQNEPGVQPSLIAKRLELNRNTIKYHTDKLIKCGLIRAEKEGRTLHLFEIAIELFQC